MKTKRILITLSLGYGINMMGFESSLTREQISERVVVPRHTILVQYFPLYVLPVIIIVLGYFFFSLLGFL